MAGPRKYHDGCPVALGMDLVGERWALLIVRELLLGPKRFSDLRVGLLGASADMVSVRLRELQASGIVQRRRLPPPASAWAYGLTPWGAELGPIVTAFARWSIRSPAMIERADRPVSVSSAVLGLQVLFHADVASGATVTVELVVADEPFRVGVRDGGLDVRRGPAPDADLRLITDPDSLVRLLRGASSMHTEREHGNLELIGDENATRAFLDCFGAGVSQPTGDVPDSPDW